jgi:4'-phosphopantetheinyl transferase
MSILLYYSILDHTYGDQFKLLLHDLPQNLQDRIKKYRRREDAYNALIGKHLLLKGLARYGFNKSLHQLMYTKTGRPYFKEGPDFNISHSGNMVVCAFSMQSKIGIDIEGITNIDISEFKSLFSVNEWSKINTSTNCLKEFYRIWTIKEAILKADGAGISQMDSLIVEDNKEAFLNNNKWHFQEINLHVEYVCHTASLIYNPSIEVEKVQFTSSN